jgi:hypothetical protein
VPALENLQAALGNSWTTFEQQPWESGWVGGLSLVPSSLHSEVNSGKTWLITVRRRRTRRKYY